MPDYAGAVAAIKQRVADNWSTTPVGWAGGPAPATTSNGALAPWVLGEVINTSSGLRAAGTPGSNVWLYEGLIYLHVFVPTQETTSAALALQHAVALGEIFRAKAFYNATPGYMVRTWSPKHDGGGKGDDEGLWFRVTTTIPFQYYHLG